MFGAVGRWEYVPDGIRAQLGGLVGPGESRDPPLKETGGPVTVKAKGVGSAGVGHPEYLKWLILVPCVSVWYSTPNARGEKPNQ